MCRITITMTVQESIIAIAEGHPGAIKACCELLNHGPSIDPDSAGSGIGPILDMDEFKIYGEKIYILWNDVCNCDVIKMIALLRAYQLGQLAGVNLPAIYYAIDHRGEGLDF